MIIIKQENLNHEIFKAYDNFTNILEIFRFEEPDGYMIIRRSGTSESSRHTIIFHWTTVSF